MKLLPISLLTLILVGCQAVTAEDERPTTRLVKCYSGGVEIYSGKPKRRLVDTSNYVRVDEDLIYNATCLVTKEIGSEQ